MDLPLRVIVADDDPTLQLLLSHALRGDDRFELVAGIEDGRQVVDEVVALDPDVLVLDLDLAGVDGLTVLGALDGRVRPAVVVLSSRGESDARRAIDAGAVAFLDKGQVAHDLASAIHQAVEGHVLRS